MRTGRNPQVPASKKPSKHSFGIEHWSGETEFSGSTGCPCHLGQTVSAAETMKMRVGNDWEAAGPQSFFRRRPVKRVLRPLASRPASIHHVRWACRSERPLPPHRTFRSGDSLDPRPAHIVLGFDRRVPYKVRRGRLSRWPPEAHPGNGPCRIAHRLRRVALSFPHPHSPCPPS